MSDPRDTHSRFRGTTFGTVDRFAFITSEIHPLAVQPFSAPPSSTNIFAMTSRAVFTSAHDQLGRLFLGCNIRNNKRRWCVPFAHRRTSEERLRRDVILIPLYTHIIHVMYNNDRSRGTRGPRPTTIKKKNRCALRRTNPKVYYIIYYFVHIL